MFRRRFRKRQRETDRERDRERLLLSHSALHDAEIRSIVRNILPMRARTRQPFSDGDAGTLRGSRCVSGLGSDPAHRLWIPSSRQF